MKKYIYYIFLAFASISLTTSCGHDEDAEAGPLEADEWMHPYNASAADQALQEKFYNDNRIYLLFNDTLSKQQTSVNPDGTPFYEYEAVRLEYIMSGSGDGSQRVFSFDYLKTDAEKQAATNFVQQKVLPHLSGSLLPFSLLLVDKINYSHSDRSTYFEFMTTHPSVYAGWRCTAIAVNGVSDMTDAEQTAYCNEILMSIINSKTASLPSNTFDDFYSVSNDYYSTFGMNDDATAFYVEHPTSYDIGILEDGYYAWSDGTDGSFSFPIYNIKSKEDDLSSYTSHLFSMSEEEFKAKYGNYPLVMRKYNILRSIYEKLGVKF